MQLDWRNNSRIPSVQGRLDSSREPVPVVIWLTGLSGAGKTTIAEIVYARIQAMNLPVQHLDGDALRALTPGLGFTKPERMQHIKNVGHLASQFEKTGSFVIVSLISPYREARDYARKLCRNFIEVFISTPLYECARRDPKGLYKKAFEGSIDNFTGVSAPYEPPTRPNLAIDTMAGSPTLCAKLILDYVRSYLSGHSEMTQGSRQA